MPALLVALPLAPSACMLWPSGIETRGHGLEEIQARMRARIAGGRDAI